MPAKMPRVQVYCYALFYVYGKKVKKKRKKNKRNGNPSAASVNSSYVSNFLIVILNWYFRRLMRKLAIFFTGYYVQGSPRVIFPI